MRWLGALLIGLIAFQATALPIPSKAIAPADRATIEQVATRLAALGYERDAIRVTLDRLSPQDIHQLATHIRQLQAAGGTRTRVVVAIILIAIAIVIYYYSQHPLAGFHPLG